ESTLERTTIFGCNQAVQTVGGLQWPTVRLAYCTIIDNASGLYGGGILGRIDGTTHTNTVEGDLMYNDMPSTYTAKQHYTRSTIIDRPIPPEMHSVARPSVLSRDWRA